MEKWEYSGRKVVSQNVERLIYSTCCQNYKAKFCALQRMTFCLKRKNYEQSHYSVIDIWKKDGGTNGIWRMLQLGDGLHILFCFIFIYCYFQNIKTKKCFIK